MELTKDKIIEAEQIIVQGRDKCFNPDTDFKWAIEVLKTAFMNDYSVVKRKGDVHVYLRTACRRISNRRTL